MIHKETEIAVIGGGPAGLAAAVAARDEGCKVMIIERDDFLGGILNQCIHPGFGLHEFDEELAGPEYAQRYIDIVEDSEIEVLKGTMVLDLTPEKEIYAISNDGVMKIHAKAVVLSMGCRERTRGAIKIPGYRPTGVYTAGLAQRFVNIEGFMPGSRFVILGSGDIGMIMARRLTWEGAEVEAVVEILPYPSGLIRNKVQCLDDYGIPLYLSHTVVRVHGKDRVTGITIAKVDDNWKMIEGTEKFINCDTLLLSVGLIPENEVSKGAGIELARNNGPLVNQYLQTSLDGIFACGNVLQVHDLVDNVAIEAKKAGKMASLVVKGTVLPNPLSENAINVVAGKDVGYVVPEKFNIDVDEHLIAETGSIKFSIRVKKPMRNVYVKIINNGQEIYKKFHQVARPSEMIIIEIKKDPLEFIRAIDPRNQLEIFMEPKEEKAND
ncbi:MAG: NAD(P)/FAD-dependent oxidoreductase [Candidatus Hodarchaeota archaeon]